MTQITEDPNSCVTFMTKCALVISRFPAVSVAKDLAVPEEVKDFRIFKCYIFLISSTILPMFSTYSRNCVQLSGTHAHTQPVRDPNTEGKHIVKT